jgi:hypothetical protein
MALFPTLVPPAREFRSPGNIASACFLMKNHPPQIAAPAPFPGPLSLVPLLLLGLFGLLSGTSAQAANTFVLNQKFDSLTTNSTPGSPWTIVSTGGGSVSVIEEPNAHDKSVRIQKLITSGTSSLSATTANLSGRVVFEARVMSRETAGFRATPYIYNSSGTTVASVAFQDGNIRAYVGSTSTVVQTFAIDVWYHVRLIVDTTTNLFDLYIDGALKLHKQALRNTTTSVNKISFFMDSTNTGTFYADTVRIYTEPPLVLNEKFDPLATDSTPGSPWTIISTGGGSVSVKEVPFAADKSIRLQ